MNALVIGAGGLGQPAAEALARAGVGVRLVDGDAVERSNLPRQLLFTESEVGSRKVNSAAEALRRRVPGARVEPVDALFSAATAEALFAGMAVALDCTDRLATRFLANDRALAAGVPLVHGAVLGWGGQAMAISRGRAGCYRCLFEAPPPEGSVPTCAQAGVIGPACGVVGALMARLALRLLAGDDAACGVLTTVDLLSGRVRRVPVPRDERCPACAIPPGTPRVDLSADRCPLTWVKTKLALEPLGPGALLAVELGDAEAVRDVPRSASEDGHRPLALVPRGAGAFTLLLQKSLV